MFALWGPFEIAVLASEREDYSCRHCGRDPGYLGAMCHPVGCIPIQMFARIECSVFDNEVAWQGCAGAVAAGCKAAAAPPPQAAPYAMKALPKLYEYAP